MFLEILVQFSCKGDSHLSSPAPEAIVLTGYCVHLRVGDLNKLWFSCGLMITGINTEQTQLTEGVSATLLGETLG